ncbi:MAG: succinate dehydrogenase, cytochrome b556 subunit [Pseudomonadales bacterium]
MNKARPVNLNLLSISFPITAIASILHRVCAVIIWIGFGFLLFTASYALESEEGFQAVTEILGTNFLAQFVAWGLATATGYYFMGTLKHLIQDMGFFESLEGGKFISWLALCFGGVTGIFMGIVIWA